MRVGTSAPNLPGNSDEDYFFSAYAANGAHAATAIIEYGNGWMAQGANAL